MARRNAAEQMSDVLVGIELRMFVVSIKARQINRRQKRVLSYQVAQTHEHARLNFDIPIVERIGVRQANIIVVGAANREMDRVLKRTFVRTEQAGDETVAGWIQARRQGRRRR